MATPRKRPELERQILAAIKAAKKSGVSMYEIAERSGIQRSILSRFVNGTGGLTVATLAKLAPVLEIEIVRKENK
jgi:transcriptional regulator with XRE-family HTH domain